MMNFMDTPQVLTQHILIRESCHLHYWLGGSEQRPLIVFMHGATMDHRMFNAQVEALIPHYRVLVWDACGHGLSKPLHSTFSLSTYAQDMLAILDDIQVSQVVLCGQSLGGYIAHHIYFTAPERVQAMIIIGSTPIAKAYSKLEVWALKATLPLFRLWPYEHLAKTVAKNTAQSPLVRDYAVQAVQQIERDDFLSIWRAVTLAVDDKGQPGLTIDVPLLLVHGDEDKTGTIKRDMPVWATKEKETTFYIIPNAGHNANQDNPDFTNQVIIEFLAKTIK